MSDSDRISGLESALVERANKLAREYLANGRREHDRLLADAETRMRLEEERESGAAKAQAERAYRQQVQAAELQLRAELDRQHLALVNEVLAHLPARWQELVSDEQRYLPLLRAWLREGAAAIERSELIVQANEQDLQRLRKEWSRIADEAAPGKHLTLSNEPIACRGGVLITSADGNIRVDHTFEGRRERVDELLQNAVAERLASQAP
jgi:V/A-type H+-transporting ATPase subunit E